MGVHAVAVIAEDRFRHKRADLKMLTRYILQNIFIERNLVGRSRERADSDAHLPLPGRCDFVMVQFDRHAHFAHAQHRLVAELQKAVGRRTRKIAFLVTQLIT